MEQEPCSSSPDGAFNFTIVGRIYLGASEYAAPDTVVNWMQRLLSSRVIKAHWNHHRTRAWVSRWRPQGGVTSPTMWYLVVDKLLCELSKAGIFGRTYADDVIIIYKANYKDMIFSIMRLALGIIEKWCKKVKLSVNPSKVEAVLFTFRDEVS